MFVDPDVLAKGTDDEVSNHVRAMVATADTGSVCADIMTGKGYAVTKRSCRTTYFDSEFYVLHSTLRGTVK